MLKPAFSVRYWKKKSQMRCVFHKIFPGLRARLALSKFQKTSWDQLPLATSLNTNRNAYRKIRIFAFHILNCPALSYPFTITERIICFILNLFHTLRRDFSKQFLHKVPAYFKLSKADTFSSQYVIIREIRALSFGWI